MNRELRTEVMRIALVSGGHIEHANVDTDLACERCDKPLLERQAQWNDDTPLCQSCWDWLTAQDADTEERIGEYGDGTTTPIAQ